MKKDWKSILKTILETHLEPQQLETLISEINEIVKDESLIDPKNKIILPTYVTSYVVGFIGIDFKNKKLYYCVDDLKSGGCKISEAFDITDKDIKLLNEVKWPYDSNNLFRYVYDTPSYQFHFKEYIN